LKSTTSSKNTRIKYDFLLQKSLNPVAVTNADFKIIEVNQAFHEVLGYSKEELSEISISSISVKIDGDKSMFLIKKMVSGEINHFSIMKKYIRKDGSIIQANTSAKALLDQYGNYEGAIAFIEIMTKEKFDEILSSNNSLESFARVVSHDLRSPLNNIISLTNILKMQSESLGENMSQLIQLIATSAERMSSMISGILDKSLMERQMDQNTLLNININDIVKDVLANLRHEIESSHADIKFNELYEIKGYYTEFIQIFQNIISNSLKYKKKDTPVNIKIDANKNNDSVTYTITDNGIGISDVEINSVFEEFNRSGKKDNNGYGIGLATCKKIAHRYNGDITLSSTLNEGTIVTLTLQHSINI